MVVSSGRRDRSPGAGPAHAFARVLRRVRHAFLAAAPARRDRAGSSTPSCSATSTAGSSRICYARLTRDMTVERTGVRGAAAGICVFGALLVVCNMIFDYARIRIVVEDRRSAMRRRSRGARFVRRHRAGVLGLICAECRSIPPARRGCTRSSLRARPRSGLSTWVVLGLGEAVHPGRHYLKLLFYASETAFFQGALAHAAYTAAPVPSCGRIRPRLKASGTRIVRGWPERPSRST